VEAATVGGTLETVRDGFDMLLDSAPHEAQRARILNVGIHATALVLPRPVQGMQRDFLLYGRGAESDTGRDLHLVARIARAARAMGRRSQRKYRSSETR
jgi:hypothetical protein